MSADKESSADLVDTMDFEDQPVRRKWKNPFVSVAPFFLLTDLFERFAYYSATGSITVYFQRELKLSGLMATQMQSTFQSIVYVVPLIGAYMADSFLGRYKTLLFSFLLYSMGFACITGASAPGFNNSILYFIGMFVGVAVGSGAVKPNLIVMGGDQFDENDPRELNMKSSYFSYFYWMTNIGAFLAFSIMQGIAVQGMGSITQDISFFFVHGVSAVAVVLATLIFLAGTPRYYRAKPAGSVLPIFFGLVGSSAKGSLHGMAIITGAIFELLGVLITIITFFYDNQIMVYVATGLVVVGVLLLVFFGQDPSWVGRNSDADPQTVDDAKQVIRMMPYVGFIVIFWSVYNQMNTNFVTQGCQMNDYAFGMRWSPTQLSTFNTIGVLAGVPIADRVVYPLMEKMGIRATPLKRVGMGFVFSAIAMLAAAFVEIWRKTTPVLTEKSSCSDNFMSELNLMWQVPQYVFVGLAEVFTAITYYDLFYSNVPSTMRSVCQAINMLTTSLGTMLGGTLNSLMASFLPDNLNNGKMEYVYFLIAALQLGDLLIYMWVSRGFVYSVDMNKESTESIEDEDAYAKTSRRASTVSAR